jgi:hypothetical protein
VEDGLTAEEFLIVTQARHAFGQVLMRSAPPDKLLPLAMTAYAGSFADMLQAGAHSGAAQALVDITNRQLAASGYQLIPTARQ